MKIEYKVTSLELSRKLKEVGYRQEGIWWWIKIKDYNRYHLALYNERREEFITSDLSIRLDATDKRILEKYVAPTVAELGEGLPNAVYSRKNKTAWKGNKGLQEQVKEMRKIIIAVQEGVCVLRATGLNEEVILYAIQRASPNAYRGTAVPINLIRAVLQGVEKIEEYMFPPKD